MSCANQQQLFLIEFIIHQVNIPTVRAMHDEVLPNTQTCVSFQVLNLPSVDICQEAEVDNCTCAEGESQIFKKGKSCLFALPGHCLERPLGDFPVTMTVYKKLPPGVLPDVMCIGSQKVQLRDQFNAILSSKVFGSRNNSRSLKKRLSICTKTRQKVGEVDLFVRVTSFGPKIVTQFQLPQNKKPYLFKGSRDGPIIQCKRIPPEYAALEHGALPKCTCPRQVSPPPPPKTCCTVPSSCLPPPKTAKFNRNCPPDNNQPEFRPCCPLHNNQSQTDKCNY